MGHIIRIGQLQGINHQKERDAGIIPRTRVPIRFNITAIVSPHFFATNKQSGICQRLVTQSNKLAAIVESVTIAKSAITNPISNINTKNTI